MLIISTMRNIVFVFRLIFVKEISSLWKHLTKEASLH